MNKRVLWLTIAFLCALGSALAQAQPVTVVQGGFSADVFPFTGELPAGSFYDYRNERSNLEMIQPGHSALFFYKDAQTGALALGIVHGPPALDVTNATGIVRFIFADLPTTTSLAVRDDPQDNYEFAPPVARLRWKWHTGKTDGLMIDNLGADFSITLTPHFIQGVTNWDLLSQGPQGPTFIPLPSLEQALVLKLGPVAGQGVRADFFPTSNPPYYAFSPVAFDASSSQAPANSDILLYEWDFDGDGLFEAQVERPVVSHVFQQTGPARVTLRITTSGGTVATAVKTLEINPQHRIQVVRSISTPAALPGSTFRVTLNFRVDQDVAGLGIEEVWPLGWTIQDIQNDGAILKTQRGQWVFPQLIRAQEAKTIVYDVTVPPSAELGPLPSHFPVNGTLTASLPKIKSTVEGESRIEVASCLSAEVALAHMDLQHNAVDLRGSETISLDQLLYAKRQWLNQRPIPHTCSSAMTMMEYQRVLHYRMSSLPVDVPLPDSGPAHGVVVIRSVETALSDGQLYLGSPGGNRFRVALTIEALRNVTSIGLVEVLPFDWEVVPLDETPGVVFNPKALQWLFVGPFEPGDRRQLAYDVIVPAGYPAGNFLLRGLAYVGDSLFSEKVEGDQQAQILECLPMLLAIAHWNSDEQRLDLSLDNVIRQDQMEAATDFWLRDLPVPGTCGLLMDYASLRLVTEYALAGIPVTEPLPE